MAQPDKEKEKGEVNSEGDHVGRDKYVLSGDNRGATININTTVDVNLRSHVQAYLTALNQQFKEQKKVVGRAVPLRSKPGPNRPQDDYDPLADILSEIGFSQPEINQRCAPDPDAEEISVEAFLAQHRRVVLLGEPGAGKSTTLRRLVQHYGRPWFEMSSQPEYIPIFVVLNQWQNYQTGLVKFITQQIQPLTPKLAAFLPDLIAEGKVLLLLDGLNELPQLQIDEKTRRINDPRSDFIAAHPTPAIVSCRVKKFAGGPAWHDLYLLPLNREDIEAYAESYYRGQPGAKGYAKKLVAELFDTKDERNQKLQDHARNPFYLQYLVAFFFREGGKLPASPAKLLEYSVNKALDREVKAKPSRLSEKDAGELKERLSLLAFHMIKVGEFGTVEIKQVIKWFSQVFGSPSSTQEIGHSFRENNLWLLDQAENAGLLIYGEKHVGFYHQLQGVRLSKTPRL